jgi:hypothetical protein
MRAIQQLARLAFVVGFSAIVVFSQTQTSGRITGTIRDAQGAFIVDAEIAVENDSTGDRRRAKSDGAGSYLVPFLPPATYDLRIEAKGFTPAIFHNVAIGLNGTVTVDANLQLADVTAEVEVTDRPPLLQTNSSELSTRIDSRSLTELPLPTRNILQLLIVAPGVSAPITNNNAVGRNSPNVSVNGARVTQNSYRINGVDANDISLHVLTDVGVPAPESVSEVSVQTSSYDASVPGGGGSVQVVGKTGSNSLHGNAYEYFRNEIFNANDANLRAVGEARPVMRRNVYGATVGGPFRKNRAFFFGSYQGTRDSNGATDQSIYKGVLVAPGLTDDRSASTLMSTFGVPSVDSISLQLLNLKLANGRFLIPTPQSADGLASGSALSRYHEEQFNTNFDYHPTLQDSLSAKFFFANAPSFSAIGGANFAFIFSSFPGFGTSLVTDNRTLSLQETHLFGPSVINEARFGYNVIRHREASQESVTDSSLGLQRSTADGYPGLPLIIMGLDEGGATIGSSIITYRGSTPSLSLADALSLQRGKHSIRFGGEIRHSEWQVHAGVFSYGEVDFPTFKDFLIGNTGTSQFDGNFGFAHLGTGLQDRDLLSTDYHLFLQDDWKISSTLTANLGVRYEMDPPPYDSKGRIGQFDPEFYLPPTTVDSNGFPIGPPARGLTEAGNAPSQYRLPGVLRVGKRILKSVDPNNFGPRFGLAWSPLRSNRIALRGGYGIFYARPSFFYLALQYFNPPFFLDAITSGQPFSSPFANAPPQSSFPLVEPGNVGGWNIDRNARTPYTQQFNGSVQYQPASDTTVQVGYAGSRGVKLFRTVSINQAKIASIDHPITNAVTGAPITDNTFENATLRAPMQGVSPGSFFLNEATAQSTYHSLQATVNRQAERGLQLTASYTFSRSIDNASNPGWGPDARWAFDTAGVIGNQLNDRSNRGLSDFDITHRFIASCIWDVPAFTTLPSLRRLLSRWQLSGIVTAIAGTPVDIVDITGGSLYGQFGARPNWATGANSKTARSRVPAGYYFNPGAFAPALVQAGQAIPSAHDLTALTSEGGTDFGNVGRNVLRGPPQSNIDVSVARSFAVAESKTLALRADVFNLLNHANRDNPTSDITAADFGKIVSFASSPRILQFSVKLSF